MYVDSVPLKKILNFYGQILKIANQNTVVILCNNVMLEPSRKKKKGGGLSVPWKGAQTAATVILPSVTLVGIS